MAHVLQSSRVGPASIGTRDLRECLLLQLDYMVHETDLEEPPYVRAIISDS